MRIIVGMSGASGAILGINLLKVLKTYPQCETHLLISQGAESTIKLETEYQIEEVIALADYYYDVNNMAAAISSGSFRIEGMVIIPCSMKTLAGIAHGYTDNLITRAADVCLKENRRVILVPRETPLNKVHLRNLLQAADSGCTIIPPVLTFYNNPQSIQDQINHIIGKVLIQLGLEPDNFKPWEGSQDE
jgi:4-hydroxy-3-polyprenylbenzoate decarboxylase